MKNYIEKAIKAVSPFASKYEAARDIYYIEMGTNKDRMNEHGSQCNYCEKCIDAAVEDVKRAYFLERQVEMGKIYEYQERGFYIMPIWKQDKEGNLTKIILKKTRSKEPKEKVIKFLKAKLRKEHPINMIFGYRYYSGGETDDFDTCDTCGIIFDQGLLLSGQELEHWEQQITNDELAVRIKEPHSCFILDKILYDYFDEHKYASRIRELAHRIIAASNNNFVNERFK